MPQQVIDKQFMDLRAGLFTEAGFLNTPDGATTDEANFRIFIDGSRKRRRGLKLESGGTLFEDVPGYAQVLSATAVGHWHNAGGDPDKDFIVVQFGSYLHFYENTGDTLSTQKSVNALHLFPFSTTGIAVDYFGEPCSFASGNGVLLVAGRYIEPFYVSYDSVTGEFTATEIQLLERDFHTIQEGAIRFDTQPTVLTDAHKYNLRNRGWKQDDVDQYFTNKAKYPALGMLWYKGYARQVDGTTYINEDGVKTWNSNKMEGEPFGNSTAPLGSLLLDPFDTRVAWRSEPSQSIVQGNWTYVDGGATWTVTMNTETAHGFTHPQTFTLAGHEAVYTWVEPELELNGASFDFPLSWDGGYTTASVVDTDTFTFVVNEPYNFDGWVDQYKSPGYVSTGTAVTNNVDSYNTNERPTICGWFAGRAWFGGINHPNLTDRVYFSKLLYVTDEDYGQAYQQNDPTDEVFNQLKADDGGVLVISDLGKAMGFLDYNGLLLLFTNEGVWEIGGSRGVFTADNYNVRKISDNECTSKFGFGITENIVMYTGTKGIFSIQPDERSGVLFAQSISATKIQKEWNRIPTVKQNRLKLRYDDANKQVWFIYSDDAADTYVSEYDRALVYDLRLQAFSKMTFPSTASTYIVDAVPIKAADQSESFKKLKFFVQSRNRLDISVCDFDHGDYTDFDGTEQIPYMILAYDNIGSWAHRRQAPKVHTYMAKTETGFDAMTLAPINESSLSMQARWDWSDHINAGEWGQEIEVYRHVRAYVPSDTTDPFNSGYPVVVTRNKVRGRGRSLHLKFTGATGKDAHLLGYAVQYQVGGKI